MTFKVSSNLKCSMISWVYEENIMKTTLIENISEKYVGHIFNFFITVLLSICIPCLRGQSPGSPNEQTTHCSAPNQVTQLLFSMRTKGLESVSIFYPSAWVQCGSFNFSAKDVSEKLAYMINFIIVLLWTSVNFTSWPFRFLFLLICYYKYTNKKNNK